MAWPSSPWSSHTHFDRNTSHWSSPAYLVALSTDLAWPPGWSRQTHYIKVWMFLNPNLRLNPRIVFQYTVKVGGRIHLNSQKFIFKSIKLNMLWDQSLCIKLADCLGRHLRCMSYQKRNLKILYLISIRLEWMREMCLRERSDGAQNAKMFSFYLFIDFYNQ